MTDRDAHRAAVEAGYSSLAEYIKKWGDNKMDLPKRLREHDYEWSPQDAKALGAEAADEIEQLREQERKMTNHALERMEEIERLREALKIFAIYADYLDENYGDHPDHYVSKAFRGEIITFGDFRKARSALQQKESE